MGKRAVGLVMVILILGLPSSGRAQDGTPGDIQQLLDRRALAVRNRDRAGFSSTVDPSSAGFAQAQQDWFDRLGAVPLADYSLRLDLDEAPDLTRAQDRKRYGPQVLVAVVEERLRIDGFDAVPLFNRQFLTFVRREPGWVIASDSDVADLGLNSSRQPWDFGGVQIQRSEHFMFVAHPSESALTSSLLPLAEQGLGDVERVWKRTWNRQVVVYLPSNGQELEKILDVTVDVNNFVAFATSSVDRRDGWLPSAPRIVINLNNLRRYTPAGQRSIFSHELLHVATRDASGPFVNLMIEEGLAQLAEPGGGTADLVRVRRRAAGDGAVGLPEDPDFVSGGGAEIGFAYDRARSVLDYLVRRFGIEKVSEFYALLGGTRIEPGTSEYHLDRTLQIAFGLTQAGLEEEWLADLRSG